MTTDNEPDARPSWLSRPDPRTPPQQASSAGSIVASPVTKVGKEVVVLARAGTGGYFDRGRELARIAALRTQANHLRKVGGYAASITGAPPDRETELHALATRLEQAATQSESLVSQWAQDVRRLGMVS